MKFFGAKSSRPNMFKVDFHEWRTCRSFARVQSKNYSNSRMMFHVQFSSLINSKKKIQILFHVFALFFSRIELPPCWIFPTFIAISHANNDYLPRYIKNIRTIVEISIEPCVNVYKIVRKIGADVANIYPCW